MTEIKTETLLRSNQDASEMFHADRRSFLKLGMGSVAALGFWMPSLSAEAATRSPVARRIALTNIHTGEKFRGEYWYDGRYLMDAFSEIKSIMRDHRTGEKFPVDPRLMDILYVLHTKMRTKNPFEVYSGYRSPKTNAKLRRLSHGVAENSLHMIGQAVDIHQKGASLSSLRKMAISLKSGGVGYYPSSGFVHIDTGRARSW